MAKLFKLDSIDFTDIKGDTPEIKVVNNYSNDIAVIGISGRLANANSMEEFWENLIRGTDCIKPISGGRKNDSEEIYRCLYEEGSENPQFVHSGYLQDIDKFDYEMFSLSPREAGLMDPNQRLFLQTAFSCIEDAGYGGGKLSGSHTGIFIGHSGDFGEEYKRYVRKADPDSTGLSVPGNIKSVIASRIAYVLDLKGPSVVIDTACSSALVAVHYASQSIRNGECDQAIAGSVKVNLLPIKEDKKDGIGIESSDYKTRTFDDSSDGTGTGEGVVAILLKSLDKAIEDRDHIYAVIKGSAVNQDGRSNGITAPNMAAQEEVILKAWKNADVSPEAISYIEAHGTGTKLGDPIEVHGIQKAFRNYTTRNQFCGIGSVKSCIGHLDHAAGIAGLAKIILALHNKKLPPTANFNKPNGKIDFINSPVYVHNQLTEWSPGEDVRRCGISSFGLSGTNCHMVLEEATENKKWVPAESDQLKVLTMSAKNIDSLNRLISQYYRFITRHRDISLEDMCYTANTGRGHYSHRLAVTAGNREELLSKLSFLVENKLQDQLPKGAYYGVHYVVSDQEAMNTCDAVTLSGKKELNRIASEKLAYFSPDNEILIDELLNLYVKGAELEWEVLYSKNQYYKLSLPTYPFAQKRCWVEYRNNRPEKMLHSFEQKCLFESMDMRVFTTLFDAENYWILKDHKVNGAHVMPGTGYIEMACQIARKYYNFSLMEFKEIMFISPFLVKKEEKKELQIIIRERQGAIEFSAISKGAESNLWNKHCEGILQSLDESTPGEIDIQNLAGSFRAVDMVQFNKNQEGAVETGPRWDNLRQIYFGDMKYLAYFEVPDAFKKDIPDYNLYPPLMDYAMNAANRSLGEGDYLPLSYKSLKVFSQMPSKVYSYLVKKEREKQNTETAVFDVVIADENGRIFAKAEDYTIKKLHHKDFNMMDSRKGQNIFYRMQWYPKPLERRYPQGTGEVYLIFRNTNLICNAIIQAIRYAGNQVIEVERGNFYEKMTDFQYMISLKENDFEKLAADLNGRGVTRIIHMLHDSRTMEAENEEEFEDLEQKGAYSLFYLIRALINNKAAKKADLFIIADSVNAVTKHCKRVNPFARSLFPLAKTVTKEYKNFRCRCIDVDSGVKPENIIDEISAGSAADRPAFYQTAYRNGIRYMERLAPLDIASLPEKPLNIRQNGTYIITGGTGGIGLEVAKYMALKNNINIALISRSPVPERTHWHGIIDEEKDSVSIRKIKKIQEIEDLGSSVTCYSGDVTNFHQMKRILEDIRVTFGTIHGIIHCAGIAGDGFLVLKRPETFRNVMEVKTKGAWVLDKLARKDFLDFFILFSSIASFIALEGQGDYAAANAFLDAYALNGESSGKVTRAINWAAWKETGMAFEYGVDKVEGIFKALDTKTAMEAFDAIMNKEVANAIIGQLDINRLEENGLDYEGLSGPKAGTSRLLTPTAHNTGGKNRKEVAIIGKDRQRMSEVEIRVANIWAELLGLDEINIHTNFSAMGGDSILSTRLLKEMEKEFPGLLDISDIFTYSTVEGMSDYIQKKTEKKPSETKAENKNSIANILEMLAKGEVAASEVNKRFDLEDDELWS